MQHAEAVVAGKISPERLGKSGCTGDPAAPACSACLGKHKAAQRSALLGILSQKVKLMMVSKLCIVYIASSSCTPASDGKGI